MPAVRTGHQTISCGKVRAGFADMVIGGEPEHIIPERAFSYTGRGEVSDVSDTLRGKTIYGYDEEGRFLRHYEARPGHNNRTFRYDAADNLLPDDGLPALPLKDNRLTHWQNLFMKYDWWGNLDRRRSGLYEQHYEYDAENRLIKAEGTGPEGRFTAHYHYDALGRRIRKNVLTQRGASETRFLWQGYRLLQEQQHNRKCMTYIYDPNEAYSPLARIDHLAEDRQGDVYWFSTDLNGAPMDITDEQGQLRWSGYYGSFGEVTRQTEGYQRLADQASLAHQPLRYAGQYADRETGLHYNLFRYYDPQVGRFTVQDPIGLAGGWNLYQYAPNPLGWIDPWGLTSRRAAFRTAKEQAKIPKSSQLTTHKYVYDNDFENRTVYEFDANGSKKYVVLHEEDKFGRGPHFHAADDLRNNPMEKGKYNQYPGHHPEDINEFNSKNKRSCS